MKIQVNKVIVDMEGKPVKDGEGDLTYRTLFYNALDGSLPDERPTQEEKAQRFNIMNKLFNSSEVDLTLSERALLKDRVHAIFRSPLLYGRTCQMLEGDEGVNDTSE